MDTHKYGSLPRGRQECRIGVLSDTHGHRHLTLEALRMLEALEVDRLLHCGDIGSVELVDLFAAWPTAFVSGNVDQDQGQIEQAVSRAGQLWLGRFGEIDWLDQRVAIVHGDDASLLETTIHSGRYDVVCHGHTHQARCEQVERTLVLNPGAVFRARPHSVALLRLPSREVTLVPF